MTTEPLRALPLDQLRRRRSVKWRAYPDDVLPLFVAETDFPLAPAITTVLREAVELGDTGYTPADPGIRDAYAGFAQRRFGWDVDPARIRSTADVCMGIVEILRRVIEPGHAVVVTPPVYPPFFDVVPEAGGVVDAVPLRAAEGGHVLDLDGIEAAFARGARAILLCNPHNPTGTVHDRATLARLAEIAEAAGAVVVSDEIHAPLTLPGSVFTPFLSASGAAARVGFALTSASKAFNLAGLKCALMITAGDRPSAVVRGLPDEVEWRTGLFGALAGTAAFSDGDEWLDAELAAIAANHALLAELVARELPGARVAAPRAGYLAWIDVSSLGWDEDPARRILRDAKVAVLGGAPFGAGGAGRIRVNVGCSPEVLTEAMTRIGALAR